jgi:hypothetical protein
MQVSHWNGLKFMHNAYMYVTMNAILFMSLHHIKYTNCVVYICIKDVDVISYFFCRL